MNDERRSGRPGPTDLTDDQIRDRARQAYHRPPEEIPREAMWAAIEARLGGAPGAGEDDPGTGGTPVIPLRPAHRRRGRSPWASPWALGAAAAAVLALGVGIGRMSAPGGPGAGAPGATLPAPANPAASAPATARSASPSPALRAATRDHLDRTVSLLTLVRADARAGRTDPATAGWARGLLTETRVLLDAPGTSDPAVRRLLEDLELILAQMVVLARSGDGEDRAREEMELIVRGVEEQALLTRIEAVVPRDSRRSME